MSGLWWRALKLALRPGALADDATTSAQVLAQEQAARRAVLWRAGVLGIAGGAAVMAVGVAAARSLERWLRTVTDGGWDFAMNVAHDLPWVGAALGGIFVLTGLLRLLGAGFPKLLGSTRTASAMRILLVAVLGAGLFVVAAVALQGFWAAL
ncbi:MAG: hypothetical protein AB1938_05750 [Myxococcota bacterium]